jgi:ADP-ribose pyrophosphatase YjhB (NUDIX family)
MGMSAYMARLRASVGRDLLLVPATGACIRDEKGRILLLRRSDGENLWGFPGGAIEPGERAADAVVREVREEIGLEVEPVELIGVYSAPEFAFAYPNGDHVQPVTVFFDCCIVGGDLRPDQEEVLDACYFGPKDVLPPMRPCCVAKARDAFAYRGRAFFR